VKEYFELFLTFVKLGCITFGGGYAMLPVLERELIRKRGWTNMDEVMDYYTLAQVTPGIIAVNVSTFIGYKRKGPLGGIIATIGFILPGIILVTLIAVFLKSFAGIPAVKHAFVGIRVAVGALILDTVIKLLKGIFKDIKGVILFVLAFLFSAVWSASPVLIICAAGVAGFFLYRPKKEKPPSKNGAPEKNPPGNGGSPV
jgi:chromate transporter